MTPLGPPVDRGKTGRVKGETMPKDVLVRGIDDATIAYLEEYRTRGHYWEHKSWSELIRRILREWVAEQKKRDEVKLSEGERLTRPG